MKKGPKSFFGVDHVRGDFRCYEQHLLAVLALVLLSSSLVSEFKAGLEDAVVDSDWDSTYQLIIYIMLLVPFCILYQITNAGNQPDCPLSWCLISGSIAAGCGIYQLYRIAFVSTNGILTDSAARGVLFLGAACWFFVAICEFMYAIAEIYQRNNKDFKLPPMLRFNEELQKARRIIAAQLLRGKKAEGRPRKIKKAYHVLKNPAYDIIDLDDGNYEIRAKYATEEVDLSKVFIQVPATENEEEAAEPEEEGSVSSKVKAWLTSHYYDGRPRWWPQPVRRAVRLVRYSRPPIMFVGGTIGSLVILGIFAASLLSIKLTKLGRMAAEMRDIADLLDDIEEANDSYADKLNRYAQFLEMSEEDFNLSWYISSSVSLVVMIFVVATFAPMFDLAVRDARNGVYRRQGPLLPQEMAVRAASVLGCYISITLLGYLFFALCLTLALFLIINEAFRSFLWSYRVFALSYAVAYTFNYYVLQPLLFHTLASDGFLIKRDVLFYCCSIAWSCYGVIVGALLALIRLLIYFAWCTIAAADLGTSILPEALKPYDFAHMSFRSQVHLQNHHQNALARVFAQEISSTTDEDRSNAKISTNKAARNKWLLAYTLLSNPSLRSERRYSTDNDQGHHQDTIAVSIDDISDIKADPAKAPSSTEVKMSAEVLHQQSDNIAYSSSSSSFIDTSGDDKAVP